MEDTFEYSEKELKHLGDAILWTTILASVHKDGVIDENERAEAIKQAHVRSFSTAPYLHPIYQHLEAHFEKDFDSYTSDLPREYVEKELYIKGKLEQATSILKEMGPVFGNQFSNDLESLFDKVFSANSSVFQAFAFPFLSAHLEDKNRRK